MKRSRRWRRQFTSFGRSGAESARSRSRASTTRYAACIPAAPPAHPIDIWLGVGRPRALALTGRVADGWVPSLSWATPDVVPDMHRRIDDAAAEAGRDPSEIRRVYNIGGTITDGSARGLVEGPPEHWIETLTTFASELGFDTFIFWPAGEDPIGQVERFGEEVVPGLRPAVAFR